MADHRGRRQQLAAARDPGGGVGLNIQGEEWYEPPVWPERSGAHGEDDALRDPRGRRRRCGRARDGRGRSCCRATACRSRSGEAAGACSIPPGIPSASATTRRSLFGPVLRVVLGEVVDDVAVDRVDEHEAAALRRLLGRVSRMRHVGRLRNPRHAELRGRVPDGEARRPSMRRPARPSRRCRRCHPDVMQYTPTSARKIATYRKPSFTSTPPSW